MPESSQPRIFLSYSRQDGKAFARELRDKLEAEKLPLWHDLVDMESGNWWHQIEKTIGSNALKHVALIVTPAALASGNVAKEWRLARANGVQVNLVQGTPDLDHSTMPKWMQAQHVFNTSEPEQWDKLVEVLNGPGMQAPVPFLPDETHDKFIPRPNEYDALKAALLDDKRDAVAITAALKGAGGFGKTALAHALSRDADIREAFFDGITFIQLGEEMSEAKLLTTLAEQSQKLTGEPLAPKTLGEAGDLLAEALGEKHILLVIDDVWREFDLKPFLKGGPNSARLITTRMDEVLPVDAVKVPVDAMQAGEAVVLLAIGLPSGGVEKEATTFRALAARLGEWPLLLELANGWLRRVIDLHKPVTEALAHANRRLDDKKLTTFDARNPVERNDAVAKSIAVSLELLAEDERTRFFELAIFPEDAEVPIDTIARLWRRTGRLDEIDSEDLLTHLASLSLLYSLDLQTRAARLHDVIRHYLRDEAGEEKLRALNNSFIAAQPDAGAETLEGAEKTYLYTWFLHHLLDAGREDAIEPILLDPEWMQGKLEATSALALAGDYKQFGKSRAADLVGRCIDLTSGILERDKRQLFPQLLGRLNPEGVGGMLKKARSLIKPPAFISHWPSLTQAGGPEIHSFKGPVGEVSWSQQGVSAMTLSPNGRYVVYAFYKMGTLWLLDTETRTSRSLEGHKESIHTVVFSPNGRQLVSGSEDRTLRLWDFETGSSRIFKDGTTDVIISAAFSPDGLHVATGYSQKTSLSLWNIETGTSQEFNAHTKGVPAIAFSPDGRQFASGSWDHTIRLWDVETGASREFKGHQDGVFDIAFSPDGRQLVSGSQRSEPKDDDTLRLWNVETGTSRKLIGHMSPVNAVAFSPDGRHVASGSNDYDLRLWDLESGTSQVFKGHTDYISEVAFTRDGQHVVSGSKDMTLRFWDINSSVARTVERHPGSVRVVAFSPNGRHVASDSQDRFLGQWDNDHTLWLWDVETGEHRILQSEAPMVRAMSFTSDGRYLAAGAGKGKVRLWDLEAETARILEGKGREVYAVSFSPNERYLIAGSESGVGGDDTTFQLWDLKTEIANVLLAEEKLVLFVAFSPDGRHFASVSKGSSLWYPARKDWTLRLWNFATRTARIIQNQSTSAFTAVFSPDGRRLASVGDDNRLRMWNIKSGTERVFEGQANLVWMFSPDGSHLATSTGDGLIQLWDIHTGVPRILTGHARVVTGFAFMPDGGYAVSSSEDQSVRLWHIATGEELSRFDGDSSFQSLSLAPDGRSFVVGDEGGGVHLLDIVT